MESSDDLAEQQLFAELQASAKKVQHRHHEPPSNSAVQSANLLNAARLNRRRTVAAVPSSSPLLVSYTLGQSNPVGPSGIPHVGDTGKLKPVSFLRDDLAKRPRRELARRGDLFDLNELSSPEKVPAGRPAQARQKTHKQKRIQREVLTGLEEPGMPSDSLEAGSAGGESPPESTPSSAKDRHILEEIPETPPPTSKRLSSEAFSREDPPTKSGPQPRTGKRKATGQPSEEGQPTKSPPKDISGSAEDGKAEIVQIKSRSRPLPSKRKHPQVVIPGPRHPKRITRSTKAKLRETLPPPTNLVVVHSAKNREDDERSPGVNRQQKDPSRLNTHRGSESQDGPPQSAQKSSEQISKLPEPRASELRKARQSKSTKTLNGLEVSPDDEMYASECSHPTERVQTEPTRKKKNQHERPKGRKPTSSASTIGLVSASAQEQEPRPPELEHKPRKGTSSKASKSSRNEKVASNRSDYIDGTASRKDQTHSEPKTTALVSIASRERYAQNDTSQDCDLQSRADDLGKQGDLPRLILEDSKARSHGARTSDQVAIDVDDSTQSSEEDKTASEDGDHGRSAQISNIDQVFDFLDSAERRGDCQTAEAIAIKGACETALELLADSDTTLHEIAITNKNIQLMLSKYGAGSDQKKCRLLKVDAYAYVFRHIVVYLESLHDWLSQNYSEFEASLDAMRIITPLVSAIVSMKDRIADWKVKVSSRYQGDRLIKDVDINLIVPLRRLSNTYLTALSNLKDEARRQHAYEGLARERHDRELHKQEQAEFEALRIQKLNRWIDLHVCRLRLEPDARRRQALRMKQEYFDKKMARWSDDDTEGREERDANGVPFSRVGIFKKRVAPPASPSFAEPEEEWTDEQMEALIDGLQNFAGSYVFQTIFEYYCGVGEPLQRFGVPEITAKATDVRLRLLRRYQEQDWKEVPEWIQKIPILP